MGKVKNLEKKDKSKPDFDKKNPENRKKSLNDVKLKTKLKAKDEVNNERKIEKSQKKKKLKIIQQIKKEVEENKTKQGVESTEAGDKLVKREVIKKAIIALKDGINKEIENNEKKDLFDEELRLGLQIVPTKIPQCPPHVRKILLDHSLYDQQPDICFIIKDQIPKKADQSENIRNFQEKLKEFDVDCIKTILPISQLKQDYKSHNQKLKLCNTYDVFLVESEIAEHVFTLLGKHFITKRKRPHQIDTKKTKVLKICIENAVKKVSFKLSSSNHLSCFEVGTIKMDNVKIADNIMSSIEQLKEKWPGSWKNISRLYLKPMRPSKVTIPIYFSNVNPNDVEVPVVQGAKQSRLDKIAEELKKKSKQFKMDLKQKKLIKSSQGLIKSPMKNGSSDKATKVKKMNVKTGKSKVKVQKDDHNKNTDKVEKVETQTEDVKKTKKKKKNADKQLQEVVVSESNDQAKKKKDKQQPAEDQPSKKVKKQKLEPEAIEPESEPVKKKKKKTQKDVNLESNVETPEATADEKSALEKKKKKDKNKNKSKTDSVEVKNDDTAPIESTNDQISIKKKKKDKKIKE